MADLVFFTRKSTVALKTLLALDHFKFVGIDNGADVKALGRNREQSLNSVLYLLE
jgi:hypothetical protein